MRKEQELRSRRERVAKELIGIDRELYEIKMEKEPWHKLEKKFETKLGYRPRITNNEIKSPLQKDRIRLMKYLIENEHTSENPIYYRNLAKALGLKNLANVLIKISNYSPLYGGLKTKNRKHGKRVYIEELYIRDMEKAKIYVGLMTELINLPLKSSYSH